MSSKRRRTTIVIAAVALLTGMVLTTGTAQASTGGGDRPLRCSATGTFTAQVRNPTFQYTHQGTCSLLGATTAEAHGSYSPTGVGTFDVVLTAANGDQLFGTGTITTADWGDFPYPTIMQVSEISFSGGTGRFRAATGSMTETVTGVNDCPSESCLSWTTAVTAVGTLSYPRRPAGGPHGSAGGGHRALITPRSGATTYLDLLPCRLAWRD